MKKNYDFQNTKKLILKEKYKIHQISISEIVYIYSESGISTIYKSDNSKLHISKNLSFFEKELVEFEFERANRNELVNCAYILDFDIKKRQVSTVNNKLNIICRNLKKFLKRFS